MTSLLLPPLLATFNKLNILPRVGFRVRERERGGGRGREGGRERDIEKEKGRHV